MACLTGKAGRASGDGHSRPEPSPERGGAGPGGYPRCAAATTARRTPRSPGRRSRSSQPGAPTAASSPEPGAGQAAPAALSPAPAAAAATYAGAARRRRGPHTCAVRRPRGDTPGRAERRAPSGQRGASLQQSQPSPEHPRGGKWSGVWSQLCCGVPSPESSPCPALLCCGGVALLGPTFRARALRCQPSPKLYC